MKIKRHPVLGLVGFLGTLAVGVVIVVGAVLVFVVASIGAAFTA